MRRGWTILELLIVLAILVAIAGIATPLIGSRLAGARTDAAMAQIEGAIAGERARAQRSGRAARLFVRGDPARGMTIVATALEDGASFDSIEAEEVILQLPEDLSITAAPPDTAADDRSSDHSGEPAPPDEVGEDVPLALLLPDGSVRSDGVYARSRGGPAVRITFGAWTGTPAFEELSEEKPEEPRPRREGVESR